MGARIRQVCIVSPIYSGTEGNFNVQWYHKKFTWRLDVRTFTAQPPSCVPVWCVRFDTVLWLHILEIDEGKPALIRRIHLRTHRNARGHDSACKVVVKLKQALAAAT